MQFWPLAVVISFSGLMAFSIIIIMMKLQRSGAVGTGPHKKSGSEIELVKAGQRKKAARNS